MRGTLDELKQMAALIRSQADTRPEKFRKLPDATNALYYRYFYLLSLGYRPSHVMEVGTYRGTATAHLAACPFTIVTTIDPWRESAQYVEALDMPNIYFERTRSEDYFSKLESLPADERPKFDMAFIDGSHTKEDAWRDYALIRSYMTKKGFIFFDDTRYSTGMEKFWDSIPDPKQDLGGLHHSGFGVCQVEKRIKVSP